MRSSSATQHHVLSQDFGVAQYRTVNLTVHHSTRADALDRLIIANPANLPRPPGRLTNGSGGCPQAGSASGLEPGVV
ncbi:uncharacterized protein TrAtP1_006043 [Trichoderma atroviride]|uniref:uncharacterized protein n=1 Tax=Hypocrea atroviridis TaxID=63577 RepID=UPI00332A1DAD|nr:hypothetical protein TrAtP1_006043 [Trichoderma atroviride]